MDRIKVAAQEYLDRQSRATHPDGKFDNGGRWYPSEDERQVCCKRIRSPSRAWPYSLMTHCRTLRHVAKLYGVKEGELRKYVGECQERKEPQREGGDEYYKLVAVVGGRYLSIYDGETEYVIDQELREAPRQKHNGGYYVYSSPIDARRAPFPAMATYHPNQSCLPDAYAVLRVRAEGQYCRYKNKLAFGRVTPLEVVENFNSV